MKEVKSCAGCFAYVFEFDESLLQVLGDYGEIFPVKQSFLGEKGDRGTSGGALLRYSYPPLLDISYGNKIDAIGGLRFQTETLSLQFPLWDGQTLKFGYQALRILDDNGVIGEINLPKFSFNLQFGKPVDRGYNVAPKTKTLGFIDRNF